MKLLRELSGVPCERRTARFLTVAAIALPSDGVQVAQGTLEGMIAEEASGTQGFGYDPVFLIPELGKTLAQLSVDHKNTISHRAKAFMKMRDFVKSHDQRSLVNG
jgi:XTP/dITP diphosphohydrolase